MSGVQAPPSGFVVSDFTVLALMVLAAVGIAADRTLPAALGALVLLLALLARLWARSALEHVHYRCEASRSRAFEGDEVVLTLTLENRKWLPVPWLRIREQLPAGLEIADGEAVPGGGSRGGVGGATWVVATTTLGPRERVRLRYRLRAARRGHYVLGPARLYAGDPFGFYEVQRTALHAGAVMLVYPRFADLPPAVLSLARPVGDRGARSRGIDDPTRPISVREYRSGDSARAIDWKVSARRGVPWVRLNEASVGGSVVLLVDCDTRTRGAFDDSPAMLERVVRTAASLARDLLGAGHAVGLVASGVPPGDHARTAIAPGAGPGQLAALLDALARVQPIVVRPLSALVDAHAGQVLPFGASVVCVAAVLHPATAQMLVERTRHGTRAVLVDVGGGAAAVPGVRTLDLGPGREAA